MSEFDEILPRLEGVRRGSPSPTEGIARRVRAKCPVCGRHGDLALSETTDGIALVWCHAGSCNAKLPEVRAALGLSERDRRISGYAGVPGIGGPLKWAMASQLFDQVTDRVLELAIDICELEEDQQHFRLTQKALDLFDYAEGAHKAAVAGMREEGRLRRELSTVQAELAARKNSGTERRAA